MGFSTLSFRGIGYREFSMSRFFLPVHRKPVYHCIRYIFFAFAFALLSCYFLLSLLQSQLFIFFYSLSFMFSNIVNECQEQTFTTSVNCITIYARTLNPLNIDKHCVDQLNSFFFYFFLLFLSCIIFAQSNKEAM